ncbi:MAG: hypothetical protein ACKO96_29420, partial [Flammeovirgaceae bacterium]
KRDLAVKDGQISTLTRQIEQLSAVVKMQQTGANETLKKTIDIAASDILPDEKPDFRVVVGAPPTKDQMIEEI